MIILLLVWVLESAGTLKDLDAQATPSPIKSLSRDGALASRFFETFPDDSRVRTRLRTTGLG